MRYRQPTLEEVIANMPEPPPPSEDAPIVIVEESLPIFPSRAAKPLKYGQLGGLNNDFEVWDNKGKGSCTYFVAMGFLRETGRLGLDVDVGEFRKMIHDYVKEYQVELLASGTMFSTRNHPTDVRHAMKNIWMPTIDWYGIGVGPDYFWKEEITEVLCQMFQVNAVFHYYVGIELRVKTFEWIQGRLVHPESSDYFHYEMIPDARQEYNKKNTFYCAEVYGSHFLWLKPKDN